MHIHCVQFLCVLRSVLHDELSCSLLLVTAASVYTVVLMAECYEW